MADAEVMGFVDTGVRRFQTQVMQDRPRHTIVRVEDGRVGKIVTGSRVVREGDAHLSEIRHWTMRNREVWEFLRGQDHPGLLHVFERVVDHNGDEGFLCEGLEVHNFEHGPHPLGQTLGGFLEAGIGLAEAAGELHRLGRVHGDITPYNVGTRDGRPVLIDFEMWVAPGQAITMVNHNGPQRLVCCTPSCASPEQIMLQPVFPSSDVYCIVLTILSWITGRFGVCGAHENQTVVDSMSLCARAEYPHWAIVRRILNFCLLERIFERGLSHCPYDRQRNGDELATALRYSQGRLNAKQLAIPLLVSE